ncbi:MAG: hypothetical protein C5B43_03310 [Verrucomicrobia bacterium]|nr:MAG: hypothetical protein C5B43_03310 [Verrucomicrobiota bacterium]
MNKLLSITLLSTLTFSLTQGETFMGDTELANKTIDSIIVLGTAKLTNVKTESLTVTGPLTFNKVDVSGNVAVVGTIEDDSMDLVCKDLDVLGTVSAKKIKCVNINLAGTAKLEDLEATGDVKIVGPTTITKGNLQNAFITANEIHLKDVKVKDITIDKIPLLTQTQVLTLEGNTAISGTITFKSEKGEIIVKDKAQIGKIVGATAKDEKGNPINEKNPKNK